MKNHIIKFGLFSLFLGAFVMNADAQRGSRKRTDAAATQQGAQQTTEQNNNTRPPSGYSPYGNIPIERDTTSITNGVVKKSLRADGAVDKSFINERTPLPYEHLRWDDALFSEKVWRELDLREKLNQPFRYEAEDDNGSQLFFDILISAIKKDSVVAFADDRFSTPVSAQEMESKTAGGPLDTAAVKDVNDPNKTVKYVVTQESFDPKSVMKLRIKEEWVFDREASRLFVRILGIAPVKTILNPNGTERGSSAMFWVYYPDLRPIL